jgi:hypothetical protein
LQATTRSAEEIAILIEYPNSFNNYFPFILKYFHKQKTFPSEIKMKFENLFKLALVGIGLSVAGYAAYVLLQPKPKKKKSVTFGENQIFEFQRDDNLQIFGNRKDPEYEWFEYEEAPVSMDEFF